MDTNKNKDLENGPLTNLGYETQDVESPLLIRAGIGFIVFAVVSAALGAIFLKIPGVVPEYPEPKGPFQETQPPKGTPILQNNITDITDIRDLRQVEMQKMTQYLPMEKNTPDGTVYRIPNEKALDWVASSGLTQTQAWLQHSSAPVLGDLSQTGSGYAAHPIPGAVVHYPPKNQTGMKP